MSRLLIAVALAAVFCVSTVAALKCYECTPSKGVDCSDISQAQTCESGTYCRKMIQNVQGTTSYVLQCGNAEGGMKKPYYNTANDYVKANVYHCDDKPLCNSADGLGVSKVVATLAVVAAAWVLH